ncbi:disulfide bond formation protein B [Serratia symbiotica]|uniref:Disulfide bond formation protein B n=1 Tax=Serratia symbiotica TaxID=138074 RepID=A0A068ZBG5_9GAMM|nr:disulfide bond formation protein B [Serratia symbiotica]MBF1995936.1 disulfide bond formation protein B [Serratia symbiotica]MBQ0956582.1 disulfide bond formation protein B [Serratia symbiotica]QLH62601.1 disulfide bond formation protein B [Serratia symbiotica]QTP15663.1 disulfide bond formation protein B [Serratia symbiotica]CDS58288.1 conserved membrane hypothetical protein [Serratia symbiotica]
MENIEQKNSHFIVFMNLLGLVGISSVLLVAFYYQLVNFELPCPLCLLQRVGLILAGFGFLLNIRQGINVSHYGMVLIGSLVTGMVAVRQILLHITPGDPGYGSTFLGLHFYTWALITSVLIVIAVALIMIISDLSRKWIAFPRLPAVNKIACLLFALLIVGNLVSTVLECGSGQCADNPIKYELLSN